MSSEPPPDAQASAAERRARGRRHAHIGRAMATFVLLVPLAISLLTWNAARQFAQERRQEMFEHLVAQGEAELDHRIASVTQLVRSGAGLVLGSIAVSASEWQDFVQTLGPTEAGAVVRGMGFIEPAGRGPGIGSDIFLDPVRRDAVALALQRAEMVLSSPLGSGGKSPAFMLAQPVFDPALAPATPAQQAAGLTGWVFADIDGHALFEGLVERGSGRIALTVDARAEGVSLEVYSDAGAHAEGEAPQFSASRQRAILGQTFTLMWATTPQFEMAVASIRPELILAAGYLFTALFGALLMTFARQADEVRRQVRQKTREVAAGERRLVEIVDNMLDGMVTFDEAGIIESFNPAAEKQFGYRAGEVIGRNVTILLAKPHRAARRDFRELLLAGGEGWAPGTRREFEGLRKDGSLFLLELSVSEAQASPHRFFCGFIRDITELKEMERLKSDFVSMVSHELRTPLTSIRGSLGLIAGTQGGSLSPRFSQLIEIALSNSERLILLINDILDLDKVATGEMEFTFTIEDLGRQAEQAIIANRAYADRYRVELKPTRLERVAVRVDSARLMQVMSNLISNAVKYSPEGGCVEVGVVAVNGKARLTVRDFGEGIPEEFRDRVFTRFAQSNSATTHERGGTGLGLSIARRIVGQLDGEIDFETETGKGTTFKVDLPIADAKTASGKAGAGVPAGGRSSSPQVLYVADDGDFSRMLGAALLNKAKLVTTTSLRDAEWLLRSESFALVVCDLTKPGGLGERLINDPQPLVDAAETPILALAAANGPGPLNQEVAGVLIRSDVSVSEIAATAERLMNTTMEDARWAI